MNEALASSVHHPDPAVRARMIKVHAGEIRDAERVNRMTVDCDPGNNMHCMNPWCVELISFEDWQEYRCCEGCRPRPQSAAAAIVKAASKPRKRSTTKKTGRK